MQSTGSSNPRLHAQSSQSALLAVSALSLKHVLPSLLRKLEASSVLQDVQRRWPEEISSMDPSPGPGTYELFLELHDSISSIGPIL